MSKINGNEIRPGFIIEHDSGLWAAVKVNHVKPGKGGAFAQVELKNLRDGRKLNERFRSEDKVDQVELEYREQQFLYETDGRLVFMDSETYEQTEIDSELLGDRRPFLQDGMTAKLQYFGEEALNVTLPQKVRCKVVDTEPVPVGTPILAEGKEAGTLYTQAGGEGIAYLRFDRSAGPLMAGPAEVTA